MRIASALSLILLTCLLAACGGGAGTNASGGASGTGGGGGGQTPQDIPILSVIAPTSTVVGTSGVNLTLYGSNFEKGAYAQWNGTSLPTSWVSATVMTATVPAADVASVGGGAVTVTNPGSSGGVSASQTLTVAAAPATTTWIRSIPGITTARDIVSDPAHGMLYVSLPSTDTSAPNTIVPINPLTGNAGAAVAAGNDPDLLSISSDFSYLWVGLDGDNAVQRFLLPGLTKDISIPVPLDPGSNPQQAVSLQAAPASPHTLALMAGNWNTGGYSDGVYVYDDAVQRSNWVPGYGDRGPAFIWIQWGANDSTIYGVEGAIATMSVNSSGVSLASVNGGPNGPLNHPQFNSQTGLLYSTGSNAFGGAFNPVNGSQVGRFDLPELNSFACTVDSSLGRYYCVVSESELWVFDLNSYALLDRVYFGASAGSPTSTITGIPTKLVRWGNSGLALITSTQITYGNGGMFLIDGSAVNPNTAPDVPSGATTWAYPWMSSLTPQQASVGGGDAIVTINGTNFTPTSSACWNCSYIQLQYLPTNYVSSRQLRVTIPANLLTSVATLPVSVFDPSSNLFSTNALTFSVMPTPASGSPAIEALDLVGLAMTWDSNTLLLYVATADYDGAYPNSIVAVNPEAGSVVSSQTVSPDPDLLSLSANGQYLYTAFEAATTMTQLQLPTLGSPLTWPLTNPSSSSVFWAGDLRAAPESPHTTAVTLFNQGTDPGETGGVVVYDDNVLRSNYVNGWDGGPYTPAIYDTLAWGPSDQILTAACFPYGPPDLGCISPGGELELSPLYEFQVAQSGAALVGANPPLFSTGEIYSDFGTGLIYSDDGNVADPRTQTIVGTYNASGLVAPDSSLNRVFILGQTAAQVGTSNFTIESFNQTAYTLVSSITVDNLLGSPFALARCGASCLAVLTFNPVEIFSGYTGSVGMLYLIRDSTFVSNAEIATAQVSKPQDRVQRRWKRMSKADIVKVVQERRLHGQL